MCHLISGDHRSYDLLCCPTKYGCNMHPNPHHIFPPIPSLPNLFFAFTGKSLLLNEKLCCKCFGGCERESTLITIYYLARITRSICHVTSHLTGWISWYTLIPLGSLKPFLPPRSKLAYLVCPALE